jgi:hypothetical protein
LRADTIVVLLRILDRKVLLHTGQIAIMGEDPQILKS